MAYPIDTLKPESSDQEKQLALASTMQQMMAEGMGQEEAQATAIRMLNDRINAPLEWPDNEPTFYGQTMMNPNAPNQFMRGNGTTVGAGARFTNAENPRLNNWNPAFRGDGRVANR